MEVTYLTTELNLRETLRLARRCERAPVSRFRFGSPCRFVRTIDLAVHLVLPEALERVGLVRLPKYLRRTSPRWGRSWRSW
jgi:hypothetical protein